MKTLIRQLTFTSLAALLGCLSPAARAQAVGAEEVDDEDVIVLSPFHVGSVGDGGYAGTTTVSGLRLTTSLADIGNATSVITTQFLGDLGATVGGAQDINFFRSSAGRGEVPHPDTITAEGLFSEYDLPLDLGTTSPDLFVAQAAAMPAHLPLLPDATHLVQLGIRSGLQAETWQRAPLNLVAVVDKSGSMDGPPLRLVRDSLQQVLRQLRDGDQLTIVLYGDRAHVHQPVTRIGASTRFPLSQSIDQIHSAGSTNMEEGLQLGYRLARETSRGFAGTTRVMLFTDERPNVGDTTAAGFMGLAEAASRDGIGLTTIGVGVQFGTDLANRMAGVRGGNLFFFPDTTEMGRTFAEDFDTMVTELAHDFRVRISPAHGFRLVGVFGLPSDLLTWDGDALVLDVATIFLSNRKGGIYFALARDDTHGRGYLPRSTAHPGDTVAHIDLSYTDSSGRRSTRAPARLLSPRQRQLGLTRGHALIDEYLTLRRAAAAHLFENDQEEAWRLTRDLSRRFAEGDDPALAPERTLIANVHETFAFLAGRTAGHRQRPADDSGHRLPPAEVDPLSGLPPRS